MDIGESDGLRFVNGGISRREFFLRLLMSVGIITAIGLLLALSWQSTEVILLIFAGLLLAIFLDGIADWISNGTPLSRNWAVTVVLVTMIGVATLFTWLMMPSLEHQFQEISDELPRMIEQVRQRFEQYPAGQWVLEQMPRHPSVLGGNQTSNVFGRITGFFSSFLGIVVNIAIILASGIFFAFNPKLYYEGAVKLFPSGAQRRVREVLDTLGFTLRRWLIGRLTVMTINGGLTALGLWILGVPLALPLGVAAALFNFIPNIGPFLAAIPAVLIAFTQSPPQAVYVVILYVVIQSLEGFILTPLVQEKAVSLPPVLIIGAQLLLGILFGFLGVLLAVPIVAVTFVMVRMLYVEDLLGNEVEVKGEQESKSNQRDRA